NLWATWCPPCQRELPLLQRAQLANPDIEFVFLNEGEAGPLVAEFLGSRGLPLRNVLLDIKGQAGAEYGGGALPTTLLFDAQGRLVRTHVGELSSGTLAESIDLLRKRSDAKAQHGPTGNS
ncbi:MAG TPA: TlpA disulfide reductase family protein, partial [Polyangiaceae bacterium]|nr:TlpA disulfide reductase family protein [Polyangiaceae bacterium]